MVVLAAIAALAVSRAPQGAPPLLWLTPEGKVLLQGSDLKGARLTPGAVATKTPFGLGLDLAGKRGGLLLPDLPALALSDSFTISTWVFLRSYVNDGPGAQIFFRGDDRSGLDPYTLSVHTDGNVAFLISDAKGGTDDVATHIPLNQWVRVTASFDAALCEAKLWLDDRCAQTVSTLHQPMMTLDRGSAPGIGIGNVQNDKGPHNQPLNGIIADLRVYDTALKPAEAGWKPFKAE